MKHVSDRFVVVLDANVLYPFRKRDALLRFAEAGLYRARWSRTILDEWRRSLLAKKPNLTVSINAQIEAMACAFPEALVEGFEDLIGAIELPDEDDRHVVAVAIVADAEHIVTENLKDFPAEHIARYGIEAVAADDFLASTFELYPSDATAALRRMREGYETPPMTAHEFIFDLQSKGMPKLASLAKVHFELI